MTFMAQLLLFILVVCFLTGTIDARNPWDEDPGRDTDTLPPGGGGKADDGSTSRDRSPASFTIHDIVLDISYLVAEYLDADWDTAQNVPTRAVTKK